MILNLKITGTGFGTRGVCVCMCVCVCVYIYIYIYFIPNSTHSESFKFRVCDFYQKSYHYKAYLFIIMFFVSFNVKEIKGRGLPISGR